MNKYYSKGYLSFKDIVMKRSILYLVVIFLTWYVFFIYIVIKKKKKKIFNILICFILLYKFKDLGDNESGSKSHRQ